MCLRYRKKYFYPKLYQTMSLEHIHQIAMEEIKNDNTSLLYEYWEYVLEQFAIPFCYFCIKLIYAIYANFSFFNAVLKYFLDIVVM